MDKATLLKMPESNYMDKEQTDFFKSLLVSLALEKTEALNSARKQLGALGNPSDVSDQGTIEETRSMISRTIDRANRALVDIRTALSAIQDDAYGYCIVSGERIGLERLLANPTAMLCAEAQTIQEGTRKHYTAA